MDVAVVDVLITVFYVCIPVGVDVQAAELKIQFHNFIKRMGQVDIPEMACRQSMFEQHFQCLAGMIFGDLPVYAMISGDVL